MTSIIYGLVLSALLGISLQQHHHHEHGNLKCYNCFHATSPEQCTVLLDCHHGKECFTTSYTGPDNKTYYHLGCESHGACIHEDTFEFHDHTWLFPYHFHEVLCGHCCGSDGCNNHACQKK